MSLGKERIIITETETLFTIDEVLVNWVCFTISFCAETQIFLILTVKRA